MKHYALTSAPAQEPITVADAVAFLRSSGSAEESALIASFISAAREAVENFTGRALLTSSWRMVADSFDDLTLDRSPLVSVQTVRYYAEGATSLTTMVAGTDYVVIAGTTPGQIQLLATAPRIEKRADAVQVEFTAGASSPAAIPPTLIHAVRILTQHLYDFRGRSEARDSTAWPDGLRHLLESQRVGGWIA